MIHCKTWLYYEDHKFAKAEFEQIFNDRIYTWNGNFGRIPESNFFGVTDDPLNPTWGVFGQDIENYPHSELFHQRLFRVKLVYGNVDFSSFLTTITNTKRFDFIVTNDFGLQLPKFIDIDGRDRLFPLEHRISVPPSRLCPTTDEIFYDENLHKGN